LIQLAKYRARLDILDCMGHHLSDVITKRLGDSSDTENSGGAVWPQALVPVPLHYRRLLHRGYNQSIELARVLSQRFDLPLLRHTSQRIHPTISQTRLDNRQRRQNVHQAFEVTSHQLFDHVAIVDDVMTSGQTIYELGNVLLTSGVRRVDAWVLARASSTRLTG